VVDESQGLHAAQRLAQDVVQGQALGAAGKGAGEFEDLPGFIKSHDTSGSDVPLNKICLTCHQLKSRPPGG
jgi:hypothetical protein